MINKVILIDHENYTIRREELFYVRELIDLGYDVEVWDISQLLYPGIIITGGIDAPFVHKINDKATLESAFKNINSADTALIVEVPESFQNRFIYRQIGKSGCPTIKINCYGNSELKKNSFDKINKLLKGGVYNMIKDHFFFHLNQWYKQRHHIHFPNYYLTSNFESCTHHINHPDFEKIRDFYEAPVIKEKYIVFVDIFFPDHPDFKTYYKMKTLPDGQSYRNTMRKYFDYLEERYKMPVVIAAHPKATYQGNEFGNRQILRLQTANLLHYCKMAIQHYSCSLSYLMYDNIPTAFVTTDEILETKPILYDIEKIADYCQKPLYNLSHFDFSQIKISNFSQELREDYLYTYLTSPETEHKNNIDILHELLQSL